MNIIELDFSMEAYGDALIRSLDETLARDISTKDRNKIKDSQFLDEKRRSFPIQNCEDVKAAVHAWGRYKGDMSFETFKSKLTRRANELGCPIPASWSDKKV